MNDRELLELAAKAAGYVVEWRRTEVGLTEGYECFRFKNGQRFDPLTDDGDALRLAVKLLLTVSQSPFGVESGVLGSNLSFEGWGDDRPTSTRRAIVRAAAEIGRSVNQPLSGK